MEMRVRRLFVQFAQGRRCLLCDTLESTLEFPVCDDDVPDASPTPGLEGEAHSPALEQFKSVA